MKIIVFKKQSVLDADGFISSSKKVKPPRGFRIYAEIDSPRAVDAVKSMSFKTDEVIRRSPQVIVAKLTHALICASVRFSLSVRG